MKPKLCPSCKNPVTSQSTSCHTCGKKLYTSIIKQRIHKLFLDALLILGTIAGSAAGLWYYGAFSPVAG